MVVLGGWLDLMILEVFSSLNNSMILWHYTVKTLSLCFCFCCLNWEVNLCYQLHLHLVKLWILGSTWSLSSYVGFIWPMIKIYNVDINVWTNLLTIPSEYISAMVW